MSNHDREGSHPSNRDAPLERAWREASVEQPPARLDAAIVGAARQSVADRGQQPAAVPTRPTSRNWLTQWQPLATAATVAGLAFVVVQMLPRERSLSPATQRQESAPVVTAAPSPSQSAPALEATDNREAPSVAKSTAARDRVDVDVDSAAPGGAPAPAAVPAPPTQPAAPAAIAETSPSDAAELALESTADRSKSVARESAGRTEPAAAAARSTTPGERSLGTAEPLDAEAWAARIATLHAAGDVSAAESALRAFRAAKPNADSDLPESLRAWARTVQ